MSYPWVPRGEAEPPPSRLSPPRRVAAALVLIGCFVFGSAHPLSAGTLVLEAARLVGPDGVMEGPVRVLVRDGAIEAVAGPAEPFTAPPGARRVSFEDGWLVPSFVDASYYRAPRERGGPAAGDRSEESPREIDEGVYWGMDPDRRNGLAPGRTGLEALDGAGGFEGHRKEGFAVVALWAGERALTGRLSVVAAGEGPLADRVLVDAGPLALALRPPGGGYPSTLMGLLAHLRQFAADASWNARRWRAYEEAGRRGPRPRRDTGWTALVEALASGDPLFVRAENAREIHLALDLGREFERRVVVVGGREAVRAADRLEESAGVVLTLDLPEKPKEDDDLPKRVREEREALRREAARAAAVLDEAGVRIAFATLSGISPKELLARVREVVDAGLPRERAVRALTRGGAEILGLEGVVGECRPGALSLLTVFDAHPLDEKARAVASIVGERVERFEAKSKAEERKGAGERGETPDLSGKWRVTVSLDSGDRSYDLELEQEGASLTGFARSQLGQTQISGSVEPDGSFSFSFTLSFGDRSYRFVFEGTLDEEGTLSGTVTINDANEAPFRAEREPEGRRRQEAKR